MFHAQLPVRLSDLCPLLALRRRLARQAIQIQPVQLIPRARGPILPQHRSLSHRRWTALTLRSLAVTTTNPRRLAALETPHRVVAKVTAPSPPVATTGRVRRAAPTILAIAATTDAPLLRRREATVLRRHLRVGRRTITMILLRHPIMKTGAHPHPPAVVRLQRQVKLAARPSRAAHLVFLTVALHRHQATKAERQGRV